MLVFTLTAEQFDRDLNGDISMSELEAVCVEIGRERKSITASLKDLDSVVSKLDAILLFFVLVITLLVLISLISTSAAGVLTSAGSAVSRSFLVCAGVNAQQEIGSCIVMAIFWDSSGVFSFLHLCPDQASI